MTASPIKGTATVGGYTPVIVSAEWTANPEEKNSTAPLFGGTAMVLRREDGGLTGRWASSDETISVQFPMNDVKSVAEAQLRCEALIRETLPKTHPELLSKFAAEEQEQQAEAVAQQADPF